MMARHERFVTNPGEVTVRDPAGRIVHRPDPAALARARARAGAAAEAEAPAKPGRKSTPFRYLSLPPRAHPPEEGGPADE
jgi:hypothetical protein